MVFKQANKKAGAAAKKGAQKSDGKKVQKTIKKDDKKAKTGGNAKDVEIDEAARHEGVCVFYNRSSGFGFIKLNESGVVPEDKVMIHFSDIQTEDRWPALHKGLKVELGLKKIKRDTEIRAKECSLPGGEPIALQDELEDKMEYVGDKHTRYLGNVKFFDWQKGFGFAKLQEGYDIDSAVPTELRINRTEICAGDDAPRLTKDMEIEFGIMKNKKGSYSCYHITLPGGEDVQRTKVEGRELVKGTFKGEIDFYLRSSAIGFIKPDESAKFPAAFKKAVQDDHEKRQKRSEKKGKACSDEPVIYFRRKDVLDNAFCKKGKKCTFSVYTDNQGVGACEVKVEE